MLWQINLFAIIFAALNAQMAKLVDALCSGRSAFTGVLVRIQFWAQKKTAYAVFFAFIPVLFGTSLGLFGYELGL